MYRTKPSPEIRSESAKFEEKMNFCRIFDFDWNFGLSERISGLSFVFFDFKMADEFFVQNVYFQFFIKLSVYEILNQLKMIVL